jgi:hypothetical protein
MPLAQHHKGMKIVAATDAFFVGEGLPQGVSFFRLLLSRKFPLSFPKKTRS